MGLSLKFTYIDSTGLSILYQLILFVGIYLHLDTQFAIHQPQCRSCRQLLNLNTKL